VLERREQFERAISVLHESLDRYPADPRVWRVRFLLAGCYRRSALNLRGDVAETRFEGEIEQLRGESRTRLAQARTMYRELIDEYETRGEARLNPLEQVYLRHARLYEADCHFEAGEYREALKRYEETAGLYRDSPSGLAAYVQMIHCHVFLGEPQQARTALARGQVVLDRMDPAVFAMRVSPETKSDWQRYFDWLDDSELF
jgi:tetratricopeptide (TPR) repeat protein